MSLSHDAILSISAHAYHLLIVTDTGHVYPRPVATDTSRLTERVGGVAPDWFTQCHSNMLDLRRVNTRGDDGPHNKTEATCAVADVGASAANVASDVGQQQ